MNSMYSIAPSLSPVVTGMETKSPPTKADLRVPSDENIAKKPQSISG